MEHQRATWLDDSHQAGILTYENTGIPLSKLGSQEFIETLLAMIARRQGFGDILAQGLSQAAEAVSPAASD
jgi:aldehyde:ferredoxin oxidoreductase